jgi:hypothetical protein
MHLSIWSCLVGPRELTSMFLIGSANAWPLSEMKDDDLKDFVYDRNAGVGTYIYVIEAGVAVNVKNVSMI